MNVVINEASKDADKFLGMSYTFIQILLSIFIPILVFYLGVRATIKSLKKKELSRLIVLKEYYYLWIKEILTDANKQSLYYKDYLGELYRANTLSGVLFKSVNITFNKLNSIDDKDLYKIFIELNKSKSEKNAKDLIKISKNLSFIEAAYNQLNTEHFELISYVRELRETWNKQIGQLHLHKHNLTRAYEHQEIPEHFFLDVNSLFNKWYGLTNSNGLKQTYNFVKEVESITRRQYNLNPTSQEITELLFTLQALANTYMMFHCYRMQVFVKYRLYYKEILASTDRAEFLVEKLKKADVVNWTEIQSY